jgi:hypothetical protein
MCKKGKIKRGKEGQVPKAEFNGKKEKRKENKQGEEKGKEKKEFVRFPYTPEIPTRRRQGGNEPRERPKLSCPKYIRTSLYTY